MPRPPKEPIPTAALRRVLRVEEIMVAVLALAVVLPTEELLMVCHRTRVIPWTLICGSSLPTAAWGPIGVDRTADGVATRPGVEAAPTQVQVVDLEALRRRMATGVEARLVAA